jgi:endonuclease/exonuclease/phosphatase family metal-dependent hydrolase
LDEYSDDASEFELRFDVTNRLASDLDDVGARFKAPHVPTHPSLLPAHRTRKLHRRIDYAFASAASEGIAARAQSAFVVNSDLANEASNHFPVAVDFGDEW